MALMPLPDQQAAERESLALIAAGRHTAPQDSISLASIPAAASVGRAVSQNAVPVDSTG